MVNAEVEPVAEYGLIGGDPAQRHARPNGRVLLATLAVSTLVLSAITYIVVAASSDSAVPAVNLEASPSLFDTKEGKPLDQSAQWHGVSLGGWLKPAGSKGARQEPCEFHGDVCLRHDVAGFDMPGSNLRLLIN